MVEFARTDEVDSCVELAEVKADDVFEVAVALSSLDDVRLLLVDTNDVALLEAVAFP